MKKIRILSVLLAVITLASCGDTAEKKDTIMINNSINKADMNLSVKPGDNFYEYANGNWMKNNPVPSDKTQYGSFTVLYDNNQKKLKSLVDGLINGNEEKNNDAKKIAAIFKTGMDTAAINKAGFTPIKTELAKINNISTKEQFMNVVAKMHTHYTSTLFNIHASPDDKNSSMVILHMYQGGLGLPDRDYYTENDERTVKLRADYVNLIKTLFALTGDDEETASKKANDILAFETSLAQNSLTRLELRDPFTTYNKMTVQDLQKLSPSINWNNYLANIGLADLESFNIGTTNFFKELSPLLEKTDIETLKTYLSWNVILDGASYLSSDFEKASFDFYGKSLSGQQEMKPRWERVLNVTSNVLGEAVGKLYVEKYFPQEAKERMLKLVENLRTAFAGRINNIDWMSDITKQKAIEKLNGITVKVGYPDKWKDYSSLEINDDLSYYQNFTNAKAFYFNDNIAKVGKPYDKTEWGMSPQTVNAYYNPSANEIVFPAAILQPPFFDMDADDAVNYGAIGVVIGHEMTHGFDDQGKNYDIDGNLNSWWTEEDSVKFTERAEVVVNQFNNYVELDSLHVNGKLTLGENIADLGGLNISWDAYQMTEEAKANKNIEGFTPAQRFYLSYSTVWRQTILDEELTRRLKEDVHSPGDARVNVPLFNLATFYEAFNITEKDKLFRPESERAYIW